MFEFVVDRLDVGDSDALLCTHPVGGATQHRAETLELRHGVVRSAGVEARRHEVRTTFAHPTEVSKSRTRGARTEGLSGLEGLLAVVGLEVTTEGIRTGTITERWKETVTNFRFIDLFCSN